MIARNASVKLNQSEKTTRKKKSRSNNTKLILHCIFYTNNIQQFTSIALRKESLIVWFIHFLMSRRTPAMRGCMLVFKCSTRMEWDKHRPMVETCLTAYDLQQHVDLGL